MLWLSFFLSLVPLATCFHGGGGVGRREMVSLIVVGSPAFAASDETTKQYSSSDFAFDYPESFELSSKPVKTHLEEVLVKKGKRQVGVVVDRIKISNLDEFGTPQFVGEKVVDSERKRDGVTEATLLDARRLADNSYRLDYTNESSRGNNHFLARIVVANGRLYVMTAQARVDDFEDAKLDLENTLTSLRII